MPPGRRPARSACTLVAVLLLLAAAARHCAAARLCQPQRGLQLDKPYAPPQRVSLPFCEQYACSCCNASHALALQRAARPVQEDQDLSPACKQGLLSAACRVCDPEVGTGVKRSMCRSTCDALYAACREDFFAYDTSSGLISPCTELLEGMVLCSQLSELAESAEEFCRAAGFGPVAAAAAGGEPCYDGAPVGPEACPAGSKQASSQQARRQSQQSQQQRRKGGKAKGPDGPMARLLALLPWKLKRRHRQQLAVAGDLLVGTLIASLMAWAVVAVLQRVMKPSARRRLRAPGGPAPTNAREVLARAAEARRRAAFSS